MKIDISGDMKDGVRLNFLADRSDLIENLRFIAFKLQGESFADEIDGDALNALNPADGTFCFCCTDTTVETGYFQDFFISDNSFLYGLDLIKLIAGEAQNPNGIIR